MKKVIKKLHFRVISSCAILDKIITNLKDRYDNKESSVIYVMARIIHDKSVADQVVQSERYCIVRHGCGSDVLRAADDPSVEVTH